MDNSIIDDFPIYLPEEPKIFVGRENFLKEINEIFRLNQKLGICAFGGCGKSTLALKYANDKFKKNPTLNVRWILADSIEQLQIEYKLFAELFDVEVEEKSLNYIIQKVNMKLRKLNEKVLLIFDNVEDYSYLREFINCLPNNVKVLITTRNQIREDRIKMIELDPFSLDEAIEYINLNLKDRYLNEERINKIIDMVKTSANEILPIKIEKIICYLNVYFTIDIDESINKINQSNYHKNKVEDVLFFNIKIDSPEAFMILQYCSLLNPDFIPISILSSLYDINYEKTKNLILEQIIEKLTKLSILNLVNKNKISGVKIHRLVQEELKNYLENNQNDQDIDKLDEIFLVLVKCLDCLLEKVDEDPKKLKKNEEFYLQGLKLYNNGENLKLFEQYYTDKESLILLARFIEKLWLYEYYSKAFTRKSYLDKILLVLKLRRMAHGQNADHPDIAEVLGEVGNTYNDFNEDDKALVYQLEDLEMSKRIYKDSKHTELARALNNLGCTYDKLKNHEKALEHKLQSLEMCRKLYEVDHSNLALLLNNVGSGYGKLNNHEKALEFKIESLKMYERLYKDDHPDLALSLNNLGSTYRNMSLFDKALEYQLKSLEMRERLYGSVDHVSIAKSLKSISLTYKDLNDIQKSEEYESRSLEMYRRLDEDKIN